MITRILTATLVAALTCSTATAQKTCPKERAVDIGSNVIVGRNQDCGGITVSIGGVEVHNAASGCPLFVIYEPPHSQAEACDRDTMVHVYDTADITMLRYGCTTKWVLFIPYDESCEYRDTKILGSLPRMTTVPCNLTTRN